jgi:hypothetical protein
MYGTGGQWLKRSPPDREFESQPGCENTYKRCNAHVENSALSMNVFKQNKCFTKFEEFVGWPWRHGLHI